MDDVLKDKKILLVEDDEDDVFLFQTAIVDITKSSRGNIEITVVTNGIDCLQYLSKSAPPDIVFLDINIPYKNGLECLSEIRANPALKDIIIIVMSTANTRETIEKAYAGGADLFLPKGVDFDSFRRILAECFSTKTFKKPITISL